MVTENQIVNIGILKYKVLSVTTSLSVPGEVSCLGFAKDSSQLVQIPSEIGIDGYDYRVVSIAEGAFENKTGIQELTFGLGDLKPSFVRQISKGAFKGCTGLSELVIPNSVMYIYSQAFKGCSNLTIITIGEGVKFLGEEAFYNCSSLKKIYFNAQQMSGVGHNKKVFYNTGNSGSIEVVIGKNVTKIPDYLFYSYYTYYVRISKVIFEEGSVCESIGTHSFARSLLREINIPDSVTSISSSAFYYCTYLTGVTFGENSQLKSIGYDAFSDCSSLTSITIPDGVTSIGGSAFEDCSSLASITIPDGVTSIGSSAFRDCSSLTSITIPDGVTSIGNHAFYGCDNLVEATIGQGVNKIYQSIFSSCSKLEKIFFNAEEAIAYPGDEYYPFDAISNTKALKIIIGSTVKKISDNCFRQGRANNEDRSFEFADDSQCEVIGSSAFRDCKYLTSIVIPNSVKSIGDLAFSNCVNLTSVTMSDNLTSIGKYAFDSCEKLASIVIPDGVTKIGQAAFSGCRKLEEISFNAENVEDLSVSSNVFWCVGIDIDKVKITIGKDVKRVPNYLFYSSNQINNITTVTISSGKCSSIGSGAFKGCTKLSEIALANCVSSIEASAFEGCSSLTSIGLNNVTTLGSGAFQDTKLGKIDLTNVLLIGNYAFQNTPITEIIFHKEDIDIGESAFAGCTQLSKITTSGEGFDATFKTIHYTAFDNSGVINNLSSSKQAFYLGGQLIRAYSGLTGTYEIATDTKIIAEEAFKGCASLEEVKICSSIEKIGQDAFANCTGLKNVNITDLAAWCKIEFENSEANPVSKSHSLSLEGEIINSLEIPNFSVEDQTESFLSYAFVNCETLQKIYFPNGIANIGIGAFSGCKNVEGIQFGNLTNKLYIRENAFAGCNTIYSICCLDSKETWNSNVVNSSSSPLDSGLITYYYELSLDDLNSTLDVDESGIVIGLSPEVDNVSTYIAIPSSINGTQIVGIGEEAFQDNEKIEKIKLPSSITSIGKSAFSGCTNLNTIIFNNSDDSQMIIQANAFANSGLKYIRLNSLVGWCKTTFSDTLNTPYASDVSFYLNQDELKELEIPQEIENIPNYIFYGCSTLQKLKIPQSVKKIGGYSFANCKNLSQIEYYADSIINSNWLHNSGNDNGFTITLGGLDTSLPKSFFNETNVSTIKFDQGSRYSSLGVLDFKACPKLQSIYVPDMNTWLQLRFNKKVFNPLYYARQLYIGNEPITDLVISDVTSIPDYAFCGCNLSTLILDSENITIGKEAFSECNALINVVAEKSINTIGEKAFYGCDELKSVEFRDTITYINEQAFSKCGNLGSVIFSNSIDSMNLPIFSENRNLKRIDMHYDMQNEFLDLFNDGVNSYAEVVETINILGGKIPASAFSGLSKMRSLTLSNDIEKIGGEAFSNCTSLTKLTIPNSVTDIGARIITGCTSLKELTIPYLSLNIEQIGLPASLCKLTITNQEEIPEELLYNYSQITEVVLPQNCTKISNRAFSGTGIKKINIPPSCTEIGEGVLQNCAYLSEVTLGENLITIGNEAFANCTSIRAIKLNNSLESIGERAFSGCIAITELEIPNSVLEIGDSAFVGCVNIKALTLPFIGKTEAEQIDTVENTLGHLFGKYIAGTGCDDQNGRGIPKSLESIVVSHGRISDKALYNCTGLISFAIKEDEAIIGDEAFYNCANLKLVSLPEKTADIGVRAFANCQALENISIPRDIETIQEQAFYNSGLKKIKTRQVDHIAIQAFMGCSSLEEVELDHSLEIIDDSAFQGCSKLKQLIIPNTIESIGANAFKDCSALEKVYLFTTNGINGTAFSGCQGVAFHLAGGRSYPFNLWGATNSKMYKVLPIGDTDFLGFSFCGKHSLYDLNVWRTTNSRLDANLSANKQDTTSEVPGGDGLYYFDSKDRAKIFSIEFAFDGITEGQLRKWRNFCANKEIGDLIFDEQPYKVYSAKITGKPDLKYIAFNRYNETTKQNERIYKGEGTIEFTCYWPYAHTLNKNTAIPNFWNVEGKEKTTPWFDGRGLNGYPEEFYPTKDQWKMESGLSEGGETCIGENPGDLPTPFILTKSSYVSANETYKVGDVSITIINEQPLGITWNSKTGIVSTFTNDGKEVPIPYSGYSVGTIPIGGLSEDEIELHSATLEYDYWYY